MKTPRLLIASMLMISLLLTACASSSAKPAGTFLKDYSNLTASTAAPGALVYRSPALAGLSFGRWSVDPLTVTYTSDSQRGSIDAQREADVKTYVATKLEEGLASRKGAGDTALRVRVGITDVDPARTSGNFQSTVNPGSTGAGSGTLEVELSNQQTGEVLFAFIDRRDNVRPSGPQQVAEAKRQVDAAVARLLAEFDASRAGK